MRVSLCATLRACVDVCVSVAHEEIETVRERESKREKTQRQRQQQRERMILI